MNNNENKNRFYWVYLIGFFIILALPILNLPPWFSPTDWGKTIIFRIVLSVLIFLFIYQILKGTKFLNLRNLVPLKAFWLLIALLGVYLLATIFSLDRNFSLWGSPYRSGGFVNFAFYIIFAILAFLIIRQKDWQKIWIFSFIIGIFVSIIAVFQQFGLLKEIFITFESRPPSTLGNPIMLAIYLLLLSFPALSFGLKTKKIIWKLFYFLSFLFFVFVAVFITQTRAVMFGYLIGFLFFILFYSIKNFRTSLVLKLLALILLFSGIYGIYFINTQTELPQIIQENKLLREVISRLSIKAALADPRISGWKVSWQTLKSKPILGYGPENFSIGFDKYYDPSFPGIEKSPGGGAESWWDRAHNFIFDIGVTAGIPALIIYFSLFGVLFWQLQKVKKREPSQFLICHGIQATFIGYLVANFFSFDTFSTYLISFLLIAYSLFLIKENCVNNETAHKNPRKGKQKYTDGKPWKYVFLFVLFCTLLWLNWQYNIKPLKINAEINAAEYLVRNKKCEQAISGMEKYVLPQKSILNYYARAKYIEFMRDCGKEYFETTLEYARKGFEISKENVEIRPTYIRNWLFLSGFNAMLIFGEEDPQKKTELIKKGEEYLKKAEELSPKRQEVFIEWCKYDLVSEQYQLLKEKAQQCYPELVKVYEELIVSEPNEPQYRATLAFIYKELGQLEEAKKQALKILELFPEHKGEVEAFLKSIE